MIHLIKYQNHSKDTMKECEGMLLGNRDLIKKMVVDGDVQSQVSFQSKKKNNHR